MEIHIFSWMMDIFFIFTLHILYKKVLGLRTENRIIQLLGWSACFFAWNLCSYLFAEMPLCNGIFTLLINFAVMHALYKGNLRAKLVLVLLVVALGFIAEIITVFIMNMPGFAVAEKDEARNSLYVGSAASKIIWFIFVKIIARLSNNEQKRIGLMEWLDILLVPIGSFVIFYLTAHSHYLAVTIDEVIIFGVLLVINILNYYIYQKMQLRADETMNHELLKQQNDYYKARNEETRRQWETLRKIKHDMENSYVLELSYLENGMYEELQELYQDVIGRMKNQKTMINTGNIGIDSVVSFKLEMAEELHIEVEKEVRAGGEIYISNGDLNILIGNLFDNAIEAASKLPEKDRKIKLKINSDATALLFEISNTFDGKICKNAKGEIVTSKPDEKNHGIGLLAVREIVNRYNGTVAAEQEGNVFVVKIILYYKEKDCD